MINTKYLIIADDDRDDQILLREAIDDYSSPPKISTVSDGCQLMDMISDSELPDLVLLDLNMPNKNGLECLSEIRSNDKFKNIKIVILSTSKDIRDIEACYNNGANLFFSKPYTFESLKTLIHSVLNINWNEFPSMLNKHQFIRVATESKLSNLVLIEN